jgi:hypothetical protein
MGKYLSISSYMTLQLNFLIYEENLIFFFISVYCELQKRGYVLYSTIPVLITKITKTGHFSILMYARWKEPSPILPASKQRGNFKI